MEVGPSAASLAALAALERDRPRPEQFDSVIGFPSDVQHVWGLLFGGPTMTSLLKLASRNWRLGRPSPLTGRLPG